LEWFMHGTPKGWVAGILGPKLSCVCSVRVGAPWIPPTILNMVGARAGVCPLASGLCPVKPAAERVFVGSWFVAGSAVRVHPLAFLLEPLVRQGGAQLHCNSTVVRLARSSRGLQCLLAGWVVPDGAWLCLYALAVGGWGAAGVQGSLHLQPALGCCWCSCVSLHWGARWWRVQWAYCCPELGLAWVAHLAVLTAAAWLRRRCACASGRCGLRGGWFTSTSC
jgi:hypothetical protein